MGTRVGSRGESRRSLQIVNFPWVACLYIFGRRSTNEFGKTTSRVYVYDDGIAQ